MAGETFEGEVVREIHLKIDTRYATILITPKPDEINDTNMPRNLHNAAELFLRAGLVENAQRVKETTDALFDIYANNPDGKTNVRIGNGCVCWSCGHCGLPKDSNGEYTTNSSNLADKKKSKVLPGPCGQCGEVDQVNYLVVTRKDEFTKKGVTNLPWIETPPLSEEEKKKKKEAALEAKRKEIEANVKKALEERAKADANEDQV